MVGIEAKNYDGKVFEAIGANFKARHLLQYR